MTVLHEEKEDIFIIEDGEIKGVTLSKWNYIELINAQEKLEALESGGVDNWEWYEEVEWKIVEDITVIGGKDEEIYTQFVYEGG